MGEHERKSTELMTQLKVRGQHQDSVAIGMGIVPTVCAAGYIT